MPEFFARHVAVVLDNLAQMLGRQVLLLGLNIPKLALVTVPLRLQRLPLARLLLQNALLVVRRGLRRQAWRRRWVRSALLASGKLSTPGRIQRACAGTRVGEAHAWRAPGPGDRAAARLEAGCVACGAHLLRRIARRRRAGRHGPALLRVHAGRKSRRHAWRRIPRGESPGREPGWRRRRHCAPRAPRENPRGGSCARRGGCNGQTLCAFPGPRDLLVSSGRVCQLGPLRLPPSRRRRQSLGSSRRA